MPSPVRRTRPDLDVSPDITFPKRLFGARDAPTANGPTDRVMPASGRRSAVRRSAPCAALAATVLVGVATAGTAFTAAAHAGDTVDVELIQSGMLVDRTSYPITPNRRDLIFAVSKWDVPQPDDSESPLHGLQGTCFGATEFDGDTIVGGGGYCTYTDADADRLVTRWTPIEQIMDAGAAPGATRGEWQVVEGSGKWEGSTGSGTFSASRVGDGSERRRELVGTIALR